MQNDNDNYYISITYTNGANGVIRQLDCMQKFKIASQYSRHRSVMRLSRFDALLHTSSIKGYHLMSTSIHI